MKITNLWLHLDKAADPQLLHPFSHYLFREQSSVLCHWLSKANEISIGLPKPISLRIEIVEPSRPPGVRLFDDSVYIVDCPVPFERYSTLPFEMVESRMSKVLRESGRTEEVELRQLFDATESNELFLEIVVSALGQCSKIFKTNTGLIRENFRRFSENKYKICWLKSRKRFPEFGGMAELEYHLDAYSMRKEIVLRRKGEEIDRCLVTENGPEELSWARPFPIKVEGNEVVMAYGTFRYEPFRGVRIVSLSPRARTE